MSGLDYHGRTLLINFWLMTSRCSQMDLPIEICYTLRLIRCWGTHCPNNIGSLLFPEDWNSLLGLFSSSDFTSQIFIELVFVHIEWHDFRDKSERAFNQLVKLGTIYWRALEQICVDKLEIDLCFISCFICGRTSTLLSLLFLLKLTAELDLCQTLKECKVYFSL